MCGDAPSPKTVQVKGNVVSAAVSTREAQAAGILFMLVIDGNDRDYSTRKMPSEQ